MLCYFFQKFYFLFEMLSIVGYKYLWSALLCPYNYKYFLKILREKISPALLYTRSSSTCTSAQESRSKDIRNTSFWVIRMSLIWTSTWTRKTFYVNYIECHWTEHEYEHVQVSRSSWQPPTWDPSSLAMVFSSPISSCCMLAPTTWQIRLFTPEGALGC